MMMRMFSSDDITLDCQHLRRSEHDGVRRLHRQPPPGQRRRSDRLRSDPAARRVVSETERVVDLFAKAGLLDDDPHFVPYAEFESFDVPQLAH